MAALNGVGIVEERRFISGQAVEVYFDHDAR